MKRNEFDWRWPHNDPPPALHGCIMTFKAALKALADAGYISNAEYDDTLDRLILKAIDNILISRYWRQHMSKRLNTMLDKITELFGPDTQVTIHTHPSDDWVTCVDIHTTLGLLDARGRMEAFDDWFTEAHIVASDRWLFDVVFDKAVAP